MSNFLAKLISLFDRLSPWLSILMLYLQTKRIDRAQTKAMTLESRLKIEQERQLIAEQMEAVNAKQNKKTTTGRYVRLALLGKLPSQKRDTKTD